MFLKVNLKAAVFASVRHRIAISCLEKLKFEPGRVFFTEKLLNCFPCCFHRNVFNLFSLLFSPWEVEVVGDLDWIVLFPVVDQVVCCPPVYVIVII